MIIDMMLYFDLTPYVSAGFVLGKKNLDKNDSPSTVEEGNSQSWETSAMFHDITYWNHQFIPSHNDDFVRAFHWLTLAQAVSFFCILACFIL